ncbi:MAG: 2-amino-4-hydroxy-6-hydroxymethyldihydropteridine diphosphokinase [Actinobacteria bacterium]|nr:2-amino-4-hydroxy-6-hydroxymethyldihydropteridine diphosphokinase [Actinomycetota bacterium]MBU1942307.1 2-amino-4-hydroxy-6-hydroxymethyldihydropteridine diphosphokinase [Actinomycetota bacterium]MBU2686388.1 2-amino-4-hydroxy-6-hydroxymethyldihydropteridine diphosphokinase [Actinomycetota bacterium]
MTRAYLGLGSNEGDRMENLRQGVMALKEADGVVVVGISSVYESEPVGMTDQPDFLNAVVAVETTLDPNELLELAFEVERRQGRQRLLRWGPRTLDVDLLVVGDVVSDDPALTLPHPRLNERRFVLEPLMEVEPELRLPDGTPAGVLLERLGGEQAVWKAGEL